MEQTQNWSKDMYLELAEKITAAIPVIKWVDLWRNQVGFMEEEHPFPAPAIFISFRSNGMDDLSQKVQKVNLQIDFYLFYETFADTFNKSYNQEKALEFLDTIDNLNKLLHASIGKNYTDMKRVGFAPEETANAGNLYRITYTCASMDYTAFVNSDEGNFNDVEAQPFVIPETP